MDGHVQVARKQSLFDLADEHAEAHASQRRGLVGVAAGAHHDDLKFQARMARPELREGLLVLDEGQRAAPAANADRAV